MGALHSLVEQYLFATHPTALAADAAELERRVWQQLQDGSALSTTAPPLPWRQRLDEIMRNDWLDIRLASGHDPVDTSAADLGYSTIYIY